MFGLFKKKKPAPEPEFRRATLPPRRDEATPVVPVSLQNAPSQAPSGWTDDCSVQLRPGCTVDTLVEFVIEQQMAKIPADFTLQQLATRFVIEDDADFALDRVLGGIVRAATGNAANIPYPKGLRDR